MLGEVLTAVLTPFSADGSVNYEAFKRLCTHLVDTGSDGVVVAGTTARASSPGPARTRPRIRFI